ncbi:MAG: patatin-like phospholipase family protein [Bacteroidales bacterium]|nr:patatin-like phospholipase family protein [Bacteroidales bacterium]
MIKPRVLSFLIAIFCIAGTYAQNYEPEIPTPRPKIGLVMSGGGAKGAAHIGVLKALEELGIPIDYIVGTSMGSIMAGMYSVGYTADQLDTMISNLDWGVILSNEGEWNTTTYEEKRRKEKFIFSIPFTGNIILNPKFKEEKKNVDEQSYRLLSEMPSGVINGQNVMDLFKSLTVGYQGYQNFDSLPIPFACVAADITRNKEVVQRTGDVAEAIRASMAIPGVFAPVYKGDTVLVDGGVANNYPVDVAIDMGADIIIGVHLAQDLHPAEELDNLLGVFGQLFGILLDKKIQENKDRTDFMIYPNVDGYNMLSFSKKNIETLIERGYRAAMDKRAELEALRAMLDSCGYDPAEKVIPPERKARNVNTDHFAIDSIKFIGASSEYKSMLRKVIGGQIKEKTCIPGSAIRDAVSSLYSTSMFETVDYQLLGSEEPYDLVFSLKPNSSHSLSMGARFDLEEFAKVLLNVTLNRYRLYTPKISSSIVLGLYPSIDVDMSYPIGTNYKVALYDKFSGNNFRMFGQGSVLRDINFNYNTLKLYMSTSSFRNFNIELGAKMDNFIVKSFTPQDVLYTGSYTMPTSNFLNAFINAEVNPMNNADMTSNGVNIRLMGNYYFLSSLSDFYHFASVQLNVSGTFPITRTTQMNPAFYARSLFSREVPAIYGNVMGGMNESRYVEHQIPFIGMNYADFFDKNLTVYRIDVRQKIFEKQYLTLLANYAVYCHDIREYFHSKDALGIGLSYTYDIPIIGPATVLVQWSNYTKSVSWMFSLGFFF